MERTSLEFPGIIIRPLALVPKLQRSRLGGVIKFHVSALRIAGTAGEDFGVSNDVYSFKGRHEWLMSEGVIFDLFELAGWLSTRK